ncbi:hypothetical protein DFP72DRAFT_900236 [Ephemerocybe angulata]|uniref:Uncharacterized protein n=1 Tax=Ephemerocybe angulata TaxID=980116 RepID=A0A8H6M3B6_9AGAR|nr:hypothetical protein DFP72DRAFT_900236 [Tulosesus angulatus]
MLELESQAHRAAGAPVIGCHCSSNKEKNVSMFSYHPEECVRNSASTRNNPSGVVRTAALAAASLVLAFTLLCLSIAPQLGSPRSSPYSWLYLAMEPREDPQQQPRWEHFKGAEHCLRFATREYTAKLVGAPPNVSPISACRETPVNIHSIPIVPDYCQDLGIAGGVWGYWTISFEEPECLTNWGDFIDRGCDDPGSESMTRRFEAVLENMQDGDNWQIMCTTTPADLKGFHFPTPTMCERPGRDDVWGVWEVADLTCSTNL